MKLRSYVRDAATQNLPKCSKCGAEKGDPCRAPSNKTCEPHKARLNIAKTIKLNT